MDTANLSLPPHLFAKAFPFHFVFDRDRKVIQAGHVLQRICPESFVGSCLEQHFQLTRPNISWDFDVIYKQSQSLFILEFLHNGMQLKGQMIYVEEQDTIFFLGSPWVTDTASLVPLGIKLKDFAIHDPIIDFLLLLQTKNTALKDAKNLTNELTQQRAQLRSALQLKENLANIAEAQAQKLEQTLKELQQTQTQLIQTEKMSSLGQLVAGIAHEINNPVNFIHGNLKHIDSYTQDLLELLQLYQEAYPNPGLAIREHIAEIDLDFLLIDLPKTLTSMKVGCDRIRQIILSLRNFSRLDESEMKLVDIHEGIDSTLLILQHRLKAKVDYLTIEVVKNYGNLPLIECYVGQLNQVFMNLLSNAIDALESYNSQRSSADIKANPNKITITTEVLKSNQVTIRIADNGSGIPESVRSRLFEPFFTTKPIGKGTGLGLSISYQIVVEKHGGKLWCVSEPGYGTEFWIEIPITLASRSQSYMKLSELAVQSKLPSLRPNHR
jgi:signal transduction histidine kinase